MIITWDNYKTALPYSLWEQFQTLASRLRATYSPIIYKDGIVRFANVDEA